MSEILSGWLLGLLLGARHALEPDHLAAVTTLVTTERRARPAFLGALWGLGHTAALLAVGLSLALLRTQLSARLADLFELGVALMLVGLGARALWQAYSQGRRGGEQAEHAHGAEVHAHGGPALHFHLGGFTFATRPFLVGVVHGLAGSGSLTALVLASLPTSAARLAYTALFGLGSVLGMAVLSGLLGWPLARLGRHGSVRGALSGAAGALSVGLGLFWGWPIAGRLLAG